MLSTGLVSKILVFAVLAVVIGGVIGSLIVLGVIPGLEKGLEAAADKMGDERKIKVDSEETLASAAHYVWDRAHSCKDVEERNSNGGYPGLESAENFNRKPSCGAGKASVLGDASNIAPFVNTGNDFEGKYSYIDFEVTSDEPIVIESYRKKFRGGELSFAVSSVSRDKGFDEMVSDACRNNPGESYNGVNKPIYGVFFDVPVDKDSRFARIGDGWFIEDAEEKHQSLGPYCRYTVKTETYKGYLSDSSDARKHFNGKEGRVKFVLCPGDKGRIQVNKAKEPDDESEFPGNVGGTKYFPYIEITEVEQESCKSVESESRHYKSMDNPEPGLDGAFPTGIIGLTMNFKNYEDSPSAIFRVQRFSYLTPGSGMFRGHLGDVVESADRCHIRVSEKDTGVDDAGRVEVDTGTVIRSDGRLPPREESILQDWTTIAGMGMGDPAKKLYDAIEFNGQGWRGGKDRSGESNVILVEKDGEKEFKLYGDLLCMNAEYRDKAAWYMCEESMTPEGVGPEEEWEIGTGGETWVCDPEKGEWTK